MLNSINNEAQPSFKAKFVPKVKLNSERLEKVAEKFEQKTKNYPNDTFYMADDVVRGSYSANKNGITKIYHDIYYYFSTNKKDLKKGNRPTIEWITNEVMGDLLASYTDSEIASKFVKIFKLCKKYDENVKKLLSSAKNGKYKDCNEVQRVFIKMQKQYFKSRKKCYERDNVLEKIANVYDKLIKD